MTKHPPIVSRFTCPLCSSEMVERSGRFGEFLGCMKFPKCRGSRDLDGEITASSEAAIEERREARKERKKATKVERKSTPSKMSQRAMLGRLRRRSVLAISVAFMFRR